MTKKKFVSKNKPAPTPEEQAQGHTAPVRPDKTIAQQVGEHLYYEDPKMMDGEIFMFDQLQAEEQRIWHQRGQQALNAIGKLNLMVTKAADPAENQERHLRHVDRLSGVIKDFNTELIKGRKKRDINLELYPNVELAHRILG